MAIAKRTPLYLQCLLLAGSISLAACGGGSSSPKDTTPEAISFTASTNAEPNAAVTSPAVTISGIDAEANISISGGEYSINGAAFTSAAGKISNGQSLVVRVTASDKTNTAKSATVTVGGVSATFSVTTLLDVTPASFTLAPVTNAALGATVTSAAVTLSGFDIAVPVSITGGEYSINGGEFTSAAGTVSAAQTVAVKLVASANHSTTTTAQLTVGGVNAGFSVTTLPDSTPDTFSFTAKTGAAINTAYTSDAVTVKGIDTTVPVSITGGEYSINGGAFTSAAGTVVVNDTVSVKATAANGTELTHNAVLTIGSVTGTYAITTVLDTTAPVAEFKFPTPYTMSEANSVKVRGTAIDEHGITGVKLVIGATEIEATPKSETNGVKDFSSWTATIPLTANAENEIKVIATDDRSNETLPANVNKVTVRQAPVESAFPDEDNSFADPTGGIVVDQLGGRDRILIADNLTNNILGVSISTGKRSIFKVYNDELIDEYINSIGGMVIDKASEEPVLYVYEKNEKNILRIKLSDAKTLNKYHSDLFGRPRVLLLEEINGNKNLTMVNEGGSSKNSAIISFDLQKEEFSTVFPDLNNPLMPSTVTLALDKNRNRYLMTVRNLNINLYGIYAIDRTTGERTPFSTNELGGGESFVDRTSLEEMAIDEQNNMLYVVDSVTAKVFAVDLLTGNRKVVANLSYEDVNGEVVYSTPVNISLVLEEQYAYVTELTRQSLYVVDLITGEKVFLSKSKNPF